MDVSYETWFGGGGADFSKFFKFTTHPPPLRMKEQEITMVLDEIFPEDHLPPPYFEKFSLPPQMK